MRAPGWAVDRWLRRLGLRDLTDLPLREDVQPVQLVGDFSGWSSYQGPPLAVCGGIAIGGANLPSIAIGAGLTIGGLWIDDLVVTATAASEFHFTTVPDASIGGFTGAQNPPISITTDPRTVGSLVGHARVQSGNLVSSVVSATFPGFFTPANTPWRVLNRPLFLANSEPPPNGGGPETLVLQMNVVGSFFYWYAVIRGQMAQERQP